jgi:hypothetical protein
MKAALVKALLLAVMLFAPATAWTQTPALDGTWVGSWQTRGGQTGQLVLHNVQGTTLSGTFFGRKAIKSFTVTEEKRG